jgi:CubicO group peptidase (beta-lactamase class C family)
VAEPNRPTRRDVLLVCATAAGMTSVAVGHEKTRSRYQPPTREGLARLLEKVRARHELPGLAAALVLHGKTEAEAVTGVRRHGSPARLQLDDRFHIASCTKSMTATLAACAVRRGDLKWTSTLADVLPDLVPAIRQEFGRASLEQLLAHAARFPSYTQFGPERARQLRSLEGTPSQQRLAFLKQALGRDEPNAGEGSAAYSNAGYAAVGAMLERATRVAWEELIQRDLAGPLAMKSLGLGYPATAKAPDQPRGHQREGGTVVELPLDESRNLAACFWPAGAVHCSVGDLARYAADHLNGLRDRPALLPTESYRKLHRTLDGRNEGFVLGWGVRQDQRRGTVHFGAGSGGWFFARIMIVPKQDAAVVVVSNSGQAGATTTEVITEVLDTYAGTT